MKLKFYTTMLVIGFVSIPSVLADEPDENGPFVYFGGGATIAAPETLLGSEGRRCEEGGVMNGVKCKNDRFGWDIHVGRYYRNIGLELGHARFAKAKVEVNRSAESYTESVAPTSSYIQLFGFIPNTACFAKVGYQKWDTNYKLETSNSADIRDVETTGTDFLVGFGILLREVNGYRGRGEVTFSNFGDKSFVYFSITMERWRTETR